MAVLRDCDVALTRLTRGRFYIVPSARLNFELTIEHSYMYPVGTTLWSVLWAALRRQRRLLRTDKPCALMQCHTCGGRNL